MKSIISLSTALDAALVYAVRLKWPLFPMSAEKRPLCPHGRNDATTSVVNIRQWFASGSNAQIALATGVESGIVAIDVDIRESFDGRDSLAELGIVLHPETWTAHTPSGGFHLLFRHPGGRVKTIAGKLGPGLDIRGDGGSINLPPAPGRFWDPHLNPDTIALADFPAWARIPEPQIEPVASRQRVEQRLTRYGEVALDRAAEAIMGAPAGQQEATLNREIYGIGRLVGGGVIPAGLAEDVLKTVARRMPSYYQRRPWIGRDLERKIHAGLLAGMREPRRPAHGH